MATLDAQPTCCRDSFRVARVYTAPRRKSSQRADAGHAFGSLASSSAQRKHGPDRSRDAPILVAARPWTPTSTLLAGDGAPPSFGKRERCPMALTAPIDIQTPPLITEDVHGSEIVVHGDDLKGVRLYCRLAAAMSALTLILLALFVIWIAILVLHWHWDSRQTLVALTVVRGRGCCELPTGRVALAKLPSRSHLRCRHFRVWTQALVRPPRAHSTLRYRIVDPAADLPPQTMQSAHRGRNGRRFARASPCRVRDRRD